MNVLFHLGHPAHFHLFKNVIYNLKNNGHTISILIKKKDILEELLKKENLPYVNILEKGRSNHKLGLIWGQISQDYGLFKFCVKNKQDLLVGSSASISHVGKFLKIPSLNVTEDDAEVVPLFAKIAYPWTTLIIAPEVCSVGKWFSKKVSYAGYNELAYLHPNHFIPNKEIKEKYIPRNEKYFILRLAQLTAHHDEGIDGINTTVANRLTSILKNYGRVYITSERELEAEFEPYRMHINPIDMHHVLAFATIYIGDSQTMAAEAGVLGVPFIRYNDFVGKISYLSELENVYQLGYGFKTNQQEQLYEKLRELLNDKDLLENHTLKRKRLLEEKIDFSAFLTWFIETYPKSSDIIRQDPNYQLSFK
jgi:predicted glycosyltransferase